MKKIWKLLLLLGVVLTLIGAFFVIRSGGQVSPGYACVPMIFTLACNAMYRAEKAKEEQ